jgi:hypothetical protein
MRNIGNTVHSSWGLGFGVHLYAIYRSDTHLGLSNSHLRNETDMLVRLSQPTPEAMVK